MRPVRKCHSPGRKEILPFRGRNPKGGPGRDFGFTQQRACDGRGELDLSFIVFGPFPSLLASQPLIAPSFKDASPSDGKKSALIPTLLTGGCDEEMCMHSAHFDSDYYTDGPRPFLSIHSEPSGHAA